MYSDGGLVMAKDLPISSRTRADLKMLRLMARGNGEF